MNQNFENIFNHYLLFQKSKIGLPYPYGITKETYNTYLNRGEKIKEYFNKNKVSRVEEINVYLATNLLNSIIKRGYSVGYANKVIKLLKTILIYAREHLNSLTNTLSTLKLYEPQHQKKYLKQSDLLLIENYKFTSKKYHRIANLFLIQCYTGFSYIDLQQFKKDWIKKTDKGEMYIRYSRTKQQNSFAIIPVMPKLLTLLDTFDYETPITTNQKYNKYLREVADLVGIDTYLTSHVARKTCGYLLLNMGFSMESISTVLGHSNIKTTQKYYVEITQERVLMEYAKLA